MFSKTRIIRPLHSLVVDERHAEGCGEDCCIFHKYFTPSQQLNAAAACSCAMLKFYIVAVEEESIKNETLNVPQVPQAPSLLSLYSKNDTGDENIKSGSSGKRQINLFFQDCPSCQWFNNYFNREGKSSPPSPPSQLPMSSTTATTTTPTPNTSEQEIIKHEKARVQAELNRLEAQGDCPSCLWTGVLTCVVLSAYFGNIACEEYERIHDSSPHHQQPGNNGSTVSSKRSVQQASQQRSVADDMIKMMQQRQRRFGTRPLVFGALSIGWLGLGAYRYHLG